MDLRQPTQTAAAESTRSRVPWRVPDSPAPVAAQQIYAVIRKRSKYTDQQPRDGAGHAVPFPVTFVDDRSYPLRGNNNNYRLEDVNLFVRLKDSRDPEFPFVGITK